MKSILLQKQSQNQTRYSNSSHNFLSSQVKQTKGRTTYLSQVVGYFYFMISKTFIQLNQKTKMGQHVDEDGIFGSTGQAHAGLMVAIWGPGMNVIIILAMYSYRKWWGYVHAFAGIFACLYTLATSIPILFFTGIIQQNSTQNYGEYSPKTLNYHYLVGIACMFVILIQTLLGIIAKILYFCDSKSLTIITMKKIHAIFGYIIVILCKSDYLIIKNGQGGFWVLLIQDLIFAGLMIVLKLKFPKMEAKINELPKDLSVKSIQSIRELSNEKEYTIFANYVYDIEPLKNYHPAGYQVVQSVKNKEVDRYIYGMFASQELPEVPIYSHSYKSFTLVGSPIAKIDIPSTFSGFDKDEVPVKVLSMKIISEKGRIFEMNLIKQTSSFNFQKYTDVVQLGRYYSITLNDTTTRLYTSVNFLVRSNTLFMKKHLAGYDDEYGKYIPLNQGNSYKYQEFEGPEKTNTELTENTLDNYVPILFKQYDGGKFTDAVVNKPINKLVLSCPKGEGLQFKHLKPGRIIMVAGGTGIYPFSDLIDLLYKSELKKEKPELSRDIAIVSPILSENPFEAFQFHLMAAFNNFDDIHPITFYQIAYLTQKNRLGLTLKIKDSKNQLLKDLKNAKIVQNAFEEQLQSELKKGLISKVWICGPPKMNENISKFLRNLYKSNEIYLII